MKSVSSNIINLPKNIVKNIIQQEFVKPLKQQEVISGSQENCENLQLILQCAGKHETQVTAKMKINLRKCYLIM